MMKGGPHSVKGGEWGREELQLEAGDDFYVKVTGSAVSKPKTQEEMEEFVGECIEACQDVEPPFLGALAAITSAWSLAKQLGEDFSWKFFQELVVKANYRLDMNLLDSLYKKYMLKVAKGGTSASDQKTIKKLQESLSRATAKMDLLQTKMHDDKLSTLQSINDTRVELKLKPFKKKKQVARRDPGKGRHRRKGSSSDGSGSSSA
jgi:hypothetical protein